VHIHETGVLRQAPVSLKAWVVRVLGLGRIVHAHVFFCAIIAMAMGDNQRQGL
jgi:hypothetical protein